MKRNGVLPADFTPEGKDLQYYFEIDDAYYQLYDFERTSSKTVLFFTILSILIACLGLFGLASHIMMQKKKEMGIR